jgi:hypothetical protein
VSKRPITVQAAAALEGAEGLAAVGFGVFTGVETAAGAAVDPASAIGVTVLALAGGLGMLACARGLLRADQWSRAPTVLTQLFALPIAWSLWQSDQPALAIPLGAVAVAALVTVLSPPSTAWLIEDHEQDHAEHSAEDGVKGADQGERSAGPRKAAAPKEPAAAGAAEPRSLGRRLRDRLKEQPTKN